MTHFDTLATPKVPWAPAEGFNCFDKLIYKISSLSKTISGCEFPHKRGNVNGVDRGIHPRPENRRAGFPCVSKGWRFEDLSVVFPYR